MRPAEDKVFAAVVEGLDRKLATMPKGPEAMAAWGMRSMLSIAGRDWDDAASLRVGEIAELSPLLRQGISLCPSELQSVLQKALDRAEDYRHDLRISALEDVLDGLRRALIELQTWLETSEEGEALTLLDKCWAFLVRSNDRRVVHMKPW